MNHPQLLVLAAGMGSRFGGLKQMEGVGPSAEVLLEYSFYDAWRNGIRDVVVLLRAGMEEAFHERVGRHWQKRLTLRYAFQEVKLPGSHPDRVKPWGTGHAVLSAKPQIHAPFLVINADDYYGVEAFAQGADFLRDRVAETRHALVAFRLQQTMRGQLPVSRGICRTDESGQLLRVEECVYINRLADGQVVGGTSAEDAQPLSEDCWTSVNFWAFHPSFLTLLEEQFEVFQQQHIQSLKNEFFLPAAVTESIHQGQIQVQMEEQEGEWFGMTYQEDRSLVRNRLAELHADGVYPESLHDE
jgi:hypothetical protein